MLQMLLMLPALQLLQPLRLEAKYSRVTRQKQLRLSFR